MSKLDEVLTRGIAAWFGEKLKALNIMNQNGANLVYTHGKDVGRKLGLPEEDLANIMPYPQKTEIHIGGEESESETDKMAKLIEAMGKRIDESEQPQPEQPQQPAKESLLRKYALPAALSLLALSPPATVATYFGLRPDAPEPPGPSQPAERGSGEMDFTVE